MTQHRRDRPLRFPPVLRTLLARFGVALVSAAVLLAVAVTAVNWRVDASVAGIDRVDVELDRTDYPAEAGNYLVVGSDSRAAVADDPAAEESFGDNEGQRSDAIMIAHVEPDEKRVLVVSIPRDLEVDVPRMGTTKINAAFNEGPQLLVDTITENFGVPITHYLNIDFAGFPELVNLVGPVTVHFNAPARDEETGLFVGEAGCVELDGDEALAYVRSRKYEENIYGTWTVDPTSDFGRIRRQQAFLRQLAVEARDEIYSSSPLAVPDIASAALDTLEADQSFGRAQLLGFVDAFQDVDVYDPDSVELMTLQVTGGGDDEPMRLDQPAADEVFERLRTFGSRPPTSSVPPDSPDTPEETAPGATGLTTTTSEPLPDAIVREPGEAPAPVCR